MRVSEVMTRDVQTIQPDQTAREAAAFMLNADAGSIPVTDGGLLIGMITDRDIAVRGVAKGNGPETPVRELMPQPRGRHGMRFGSPGRRNPAGRRTPAVSASNPSLRGADATRQSRALDCFAMLAMTVIGRRSR